MLPRFAETSSDLFKVDQFEFSDSHLYWAATGQPSASEWRQKMSTVSPSVQRAWLPENGY